MTMPPELQHMFAMQAAAARTETATAFLLLLTDGAVSGVLEMNDGADDRHEENR
jgi:hypothetical protein